MLGVKPDVPDRDLRAAYRARAMVLHPDRNEDPDAHAELRRLNTLWEQVRTPALRAAYDVTLELGRREAERVRRRGERLQAEAERARAEHVAAAAAAAARNAGNPRPRPAPPPPEPPPRKPRKPVPWGRVADVLRDVFESYTGRKK